MKIHRNENNTGFRIFPIFRKLDLPKGRSLAQRLSSKLSPMQKFLAPFSLPLRLNQKRAIQPQHQHIIAVKFVEFLERCLAVLAGCRQPWGQIVVLALLVHGLGPELYVQVDRLVY